MCTFESRAASRVSRSSLVRELMMNMCSVRGLVTAAGTVPETAGSSNPAGAAEKP
jgi:hypothetical protein